MTPITVWYRWLRNDGGDYYWDFNHVEDGHITTDLPTPKCPEHKRIWQGKWKFEHAWLTDELPGKVVRTPQ
jgi:hypothetical protein